MKVSLIDFLNNLAKGIILSFVLIIVLQNQVLAQETNEDETEKLSEKEPKKELDPEEIIARKTALRSAIIPGWGQASNGGAHFVKIPIIYGALGTLAYAAYFNHSKFECYREGYLLKSKGLYFEGCDGFNTVSTLKSGMEAYHKNRDLFVIATVGVYALNILDAYIWAHMKLFDNSDDLTLRLKPSYINIVGMQHAGFTLTMQF